MLRNNYSPSLGIGTIRSLGHAWGRLFRLDRADHSGGSVWPSATNQPLTCAKLLHMKLRGDVTMPSVFEHRVVDQRQRDFLGALVPRHPAW